MHSAGPAPDDGPLDLPAGVASMAGDIDADWGDAQDDNDPDSVRARTLRWTLLPLTPRCATRSS
eukprot:8786716-Alexandrium_andersonii.AAC.1